MKSTRFTKVWAATVGILLFANTAWMNADNDVVIFNTDLSDLTPTPTINTNSGTYTTPDGSVKLVGNRYNDTTADRAPCINGDTLKPNAPGVYYIRTSNTSPDLGVSQSTEITPTSPFVNGGIIEVTFSIISTPNNNDWCSAAIDGSKIGGINPTTIPGAARDKYITGQIVVPPSTQGVKTIRLFREGGNATYLWRIKIYTNNAQTSIKKDPDTSKTIISETYYTLTGLKTTEINTAGVYVKKVIYEDGSAETTKIIHP